MMSARDNRRRAHGEANIWDLSELIQPLALLPHGLIRIMFRKIAESYERSST